MGLLFRDTVLCSYLPTNFLTEKHYRFKGRNSNHQLELILNLKDFVCKPFPADYFSGKNTRKTTLVDMVKYLASKVKHISRSLFDVLKQFNCKLRHSAANSFISSTFAVCTGGSLLSYFNSVFLDFVFFLIFYISCAFLTKK